MALFSSNTKKCIHPAERVARTLCDLHDLFSFFDESVENELKMGSLGVACEVFEQTKDAVTEVVTAVSLKHLNDTKKQLICLKADELRRNFCEKGSTPADEARRQC